MEEFRGKTIGYDLSCLLHKIVSTKQGSDELHAKPPMPFASLAGIVDAEVKKFHPFGVKVIMVADGASHPMKIASEKRCADNARNMDEIRRMWSGGNVADLPALQKLKKRHAIIPPNLLYETTKYLKAKHNIVTVGAPFEAEWQLAEMERIEEIDAVCTLDSDSLPLGCQTVIHKMKWVESEASNDDIYDESGVLNPHNKKTLKVLQFHLFESITFN